MISAEVVKQGETVSVFLKETSTFNTGYTFFWRMAGIDSAVVPFGNQPQYSIDTSKIPELGKQRIQLVLRNKSNTAESHNASVYFMLEAKVAEQTQTTSSTPTPIVEVTPKGTWSRTDTLKNDLRVTPSQAPSKGQKVKFYFSEGSKYNDGSYTFRWTISGHSKLGTGKGKSRTIDTSKMDAGEYRQVFTLSNDTGSYNGSVNFSVEQADSPATTDTGASTEIPTIPTADFATRKPLIVKDKETVSVGDKVTFSLDAIYEGARFYWVFDGNGITAQKGSTSNLMVDTTGFSPGKYRLRGTVTSKDRKQHQVSMWVDVKEGNWIGIDIDLDPDEDLIQYQGIGYELLLPDGSKITGAIGDQKVFRINVPKDVEQAEFRWVD